MGNENDVPSLRPFFDEGLVAEVLGVVKSGKEATVYCCRGAGRNGTALLAAKVYRPRTLRSFRNDAVYRTGRVITDARLRRAVRKKTRAGRGVGFGMWVSHEYETLKLLHAAGAAVPRPVHCAGSAILMEYVGDAAGAAPMLNDVHLPSGDARGVFRQIMRNIELFLACDRVHADLSAFNILYRAGRIRIIDFPQAVDPRVNPNALDLLRRDIANICRHFARYGADVNPLQRAGEMWARYLRGEL